MQKETISDIKSFDHNVVTTLFTWWKTSTLNTDLPYCVCLHCRVKANDL
jgi:hypothetical protein